VVVSLDLVVRRRGAVKRALAVGRRIRICCLDQGCLCREEMLGLAEQTTKTEQTLGEWSL